MLKQALLLAEKGLLPDSLVRFGIRQLLKKRLNEIKNVDAEKSQFLKTSFLKSMDQAPIALVPHLANKQHYEVPSTFFDFCLGKYKKYSSCYWDNHTKNLDDAEFNALKISATHADLKDGQTILELGCGWGSLTLFMAQHYPKSRIYAVSNSNSQRVFIENEAKKRKLKNMHVITCDMNRFNPKNFKIPKSFDRIVSIEMFEHMRNHRKLYRMLYEWLKPGGKFFMHIFVHQHTPYAFEVKDQDDWMSRFFFSGGMMPSDDLPLHFQEHLKLNQKWCWDGTHYEKTANAWLDNMDQNKSDIYPILKKTYGHRNAAQWFNRWRIFYMACAELFGYRNGQEWWVTHYQFERPKK